MLKYHNFLTLKKFDNHKNTFIFIRYFCFIMFIPSFSIYGCIKKYICLTFSLSVAVFSKPGCFSLHGAYGVFYYGLIFTLHATGKSGDIIRTCNDDEFELHFQMRKMLPPTVWNGLPLHKMFLTFAWILYLLICNLQRITVMSSWARRRLKSPVSRLFAWPFVRAQIKENIKAPSHWLLWGESTGDRWIPLTTDQWRGKCFHLMTSSCTDRSHSSWFIVILLVTH